MARSSTVAGVAGETQCSDSRSPLRARLFFAVLLLTAALQAGAAMPAAASSSYTVLVSYADSLRANPANFPTPWAGASNVIFEGCAGGAASCTNGGLDGGAVAIVNTSSATQTVNSVVITYDSSCIYDIWPHDVSLPAGDELIVAENEGGGPLGCSVSTGQMDGSDIGPNGQNWAGNCSQSGLTPTVAVTVGGTTTNFTDTGQVLNTGGTDANSCGHPNESEQWTGIGGSICYGLTVGLSPASKFVTPSTSVPVKATVKNGCGQPLGGEEVTFQITSGPNAGGSQTVGTNAAGVATYTDAITPSSTSTQGLDVITASLSNPAGTIMSKPAYIGFEQATLKLVPSSGTATTSVKATGTGYAPSEQVALTWGAATGPALTHNGLPVVVAANGSGDISATFQPPSTATAGTYGVFATGQTSGNEGIALFTMASNTVASIGIVKGTVYNTSTGGQFVPSGGALFTQPFASLAFDPDTNTPISCSNSTGVNSNTRPFVNVTPALDGSCKAVVVQNPGGTLQAGSGGLNQFDMVITGKLTVPLAGSVQFDGFSDDGFALGFGKDSAGSQPTYVSGALNKGNLSTTYQHSYPIAGADIGEHGPEDAGFVVNFPTAGTYPLELDYEECCSGQLQMVLDAGGKLLVSTSQISLSSKSFPAGSTVPFTGMGFGPGETVNAYVDSSSSAVIGSAVATAGGAVSGNVTVPPTTAAGTHEIVFVGQSTGASAEVKVSVS